MMDMTFLDMRRNPRKILEAIDRHESVTLSRRGKPVASIEPLVKSERPKVAEHPAFGMWAERPETANPSKMVREMRKGRFDDL